MREGDARTLVEFLRTQLTREERIARAAMAGDGGQDGGFEDATWLDDSTDPLYARIATDAANLIRATAVPRRALAEVDAKRRIMEEHAYDPLNGCRKCADGIRWVNDRPLVNPNDWPCLTLRLLALPYADQAGYRPEWRPDPARPAPAAEGSQH